MRTLTRATISVYAALAELGHSLPALFISSDSTRAHRRPSSAVAVRLIRSYDKQTTLSIWLQIELAISNLSHASQVALLQTLKSCDDSRKQRNATIVTFYVDWGSVIIPATSRLIRHKRSRGNLHVAILKLNS